MFWDTHTNPTGALSIVAVTNSEYFENNTFDAAVGNGAIRLPWIKAWNDWNSHDVWREDKAGNVFVRREKNVPVKENVNTKFGEGRVCWRGKGAVRGAMCLLCSICPKQQATKADGDLIEDSNTRDGTGNRIDKILSGIRPRHGERALGAGDNYGLIEADKQKAECRGDVRKGICAGDNNKRVATVSIVMQATSQGDPVVGGEPTAVAVEDDLQIEVCTQFTQLWDEMENVPKKHSRL
jgi:hypothetical protein